MKAWAAVVAVMVASCSGGGGTDAGIATTHGFLLGQWDGRLQAGSVFVEHAVAVTISATGDPARFAATMQWGTGGCAGTLAGQATAAGNRVAFSFGACSADLNAPSETRLQGAYSNPGAAAGPCLNDLGTITLDKRPAVPVLLHARPSVEVFDLGDLVIVWARR